MHTYVHVYTSPTTFLILQKRTDGFKDRYVKPTNPEYLEFCKNHTPAEQAWVEPTPVPVPTPEELLAKKIEAALAETEFTAKELLDAFKTIYGNIDLLDSLLKSNAEFAWYFSKYDVIDLNHEVTKAALVNVPEDVIRKVKLCVKGLPYAE